MTTNRKLACAVLSLLILLGGALPARAELVHYVIGDEGDADPVLHGPAFDLGGGGKDVDRAMQWVIDQVRGCSGCEVDLDLVILRSSGSDGYNEWFELLDGIDSIETFVVTDRDSALRPEVAEVVRRAEIVFFAGGDQCNYVTYFKGTPVHHAIEAVIARGGGVGGTSAGLAIMGELTYDACSGGSSQSADALSDPFHPDISLSSGFFRWQYMNDTITDTHFSERDRLGRLIVFMARYLADQPAGTGVMGIGVDERTSLVVDRNGMARVMGDGPVYFLRGSSPPETLEHGTPLSWSGLESWVIPSGGSFDLKDRPDRSAGTVSVLDGEIIGHPE